MAYFAVSLEGGGGAITQKKPVTNPQTQGPVAYTDNPIFDSGDKEAQSGSSLKDTAIEKYKQLSDWQANHAVNDYTFLSNMLKGNAVLEQAASMYQNENITDDQIARLDELVAKQNTIMDGYEQLYNDNKAAIGAQYDFMDGKDVANNDEYFGQIYNFALGQLYGDDKDESQDIDKEEYKNAEVSSETELAQKLGMEAIDIPEEDLYEGFGIMDIDGDGKLNAAELALPYWVADQLDGNEDGKFDIDTMSTVMSQMQDPANQEVIKGMYDVIKTYMPQ